MKNKKENKKITYSITILMNGDDGTDIKSTRIGLTASQAVKIYGNFNYSLENTK